MVRVMETKSLKSALAFLWKWGGVIPNIMFTQDTVMSYKLLQ